MKIYPNSKFESKYWNNDRFVAGVDETGRGSIAGPVVAAAVVLPVDFPGIKGLNDSKQISFKNRLKIYDQIMTLAVDYSVAFIDNHEIDKTDILTCTVKAMNNAVNSLKSDVRYVLIDGNYFIPKFNTPYETIVKGDEKSVSIAAASIIAKVTRDKWMIDNADKEYPGYHFKTNMGYGTAQHFSAIDKLGICDLHRESFLKKHYPNQLNLL